MLRKPLLYFVLFLACVLIMDQSTDATVRIASRINNYIGLSTDTKPSGTTVPVGSTFTETDMGGRQLVYDGSSWVLGNGYTSDPDTTTAKGSSVARAANGWAGYTVFCSLSGVSTSVLVYIEGKATGGGWVNLNSSGDSSYIDSNGEFAWAYTGHVDSVRATVSAGSGETAFQAIWKWVFGGND
jgi:hypothetical protein